MVDIILTRLQNVKGCLVVTGWSGDEDKVHHDHFGDRKCVKPVKGCLFLLRVLHRVLLTHTHRERERERERER